MVPGHNRQTYHLTLVVQTETIVFVLGNKIKFCLVVLIFGSRSMVALFIRHKAVVNVKLRRFHNTESFKAGSRLEDRQALLNRYNVVYRLTCSCGASYIGQTQRNLINNIEEHRALTLQSVDTCKPTQTIGLTFTTPRSLAVTIGGGCRFLNIY